MCAIGTPTLRQTRDLSPKPAPIIDAAAACVVDIGTPSCVAPNIEVTAPTFAANPELQLSLAMPTPIVSMMPQPPYTVPAAMTTFELSSTHNGTAYMLQASRKSVKRRTAQAHCSGAAASSAACPDAASTASTMPAVF